MYFVALCLVLQPEATYYSPTLEDSIFAHAAMMRIVSSEDATLGRTVHDMRRNKCATISFIDTGGRSVILRLTFHGQDGVRYSACHHEWPFSAPDLFGSGKPNGL